MLKGDAGNDILVGGAGDDTLTGRTGDDTFVLDAGGDDDEITDLTIGEDLLGASALTDVGNALAIQEIEAAHGFQRAHDFRRPVVAVTTQGDGHGRPVGAYAADQMAQHARRFLAREAFAGAQQDCNGFDCCCLVDVDGL